MIYICSDPPVAPPAKEDLDREVLEMGSNVQQLELHEEKEGDKNEVEEEKEDRDHKILQMGSSLVQQEPHRKEEEEDWDVDLEVMRSSLLQLQLLANCTAFRLVTNPPRLQLEQTCLSWLIQV